MTALRGRRKAMLTIEQISKIFTLETQKRVETESLPMNASSARLAVEIKEASFCWDFTKGVSSVKASDDQTPVLKDISLTLKKRDYLAIIGDPGCGKTSLLYSILGHTTRTSGTMFTYGKVAMADKDPFIMDDTL